MQMISVQYKTAGRTDVNIYEITVQEAQVLTPHSQLKNVSTESI